MERIWKTMVPQVVDTVDSPNYIKFSLPPLPWHNYAMFKSTENKETTNRDAATTAVVYTHTAYNTIISFHEHGNPDIIAHSRGITT